VIIVTDDVGAIGLFETSSKTCHSTSSRLFLSLEVIITILVINDHSE